MAQHAELKVRLLIRDQDPTMLLASVNRAKGSLRGFIAFLINLLNLIASKGMGLVATVRGVTISSAYGEFTCAVASATVGDKIRVDLPNGQIVFLTSVASSADASAGQWLLGASNAAMATNIAAAWNAYPPTAKYGTAATNSATVQITARSDDLSGNSIKLSEVVTTAAATSLTSTPTALGSLMNGVTAQRMAPTLTNTITLGANPSVNDTLRFGGYLLTYKASASNENEVTIGADANETATNLAAKLNAHSVLGKLFTAVAATNVVTNTWSNADVFLAKMMYLVGTGTNPGTISGQFTSTAITPTISATPTAFNVP